MSSSAIVGIEFGFAPPIRVPSQVPSEYALKNKILAMISPHQREVLLQKAQLVHLPAGYVINARDTPIRYCFFPVTAVVALLSGLEDGRTMEVGIIGNEGMAGAQLVLGCRATTHLTVAQVAGSAVRVPARTVWDMFRQGEEFRDELLGSLSSYLCQVSQIAVCNRAHPLEQRLSRWILNIDDRVGYGEIQITHELLAQLLGSNRADVSRAIGMLRKKSAISVSRRHLKVLNRSELESLACECYESVRNSLHSVQAGRVAQVWREEGNPRAFQIPPISRYKI